MNAGACGPCQTAPSARCALLDVFPQYVLRLLVGGILGHPLGHAFTEDREQRIAGVFVLAEQMRITLRHVAGYFVYARYTARVLAAPCGGVKGIDVPAAEAGKVVASVA